MKINKVNYKSDFDLLATMKCYDTSGKEIEIGFADYDWELDLYTGCGNYAPKVYKVSYIGGKATNCFNDNGKVHIVCDNHSLNLGVLNGTIRAKIPNAIYPDGTQLIVSPLTFAIELVADGGDTPSPIEVEIMLPYLYDSAYRIAQQGGYQGTQEEYYQLASQLPNAVETANKVQASADSLADSAEQIGGAIETLTTTTDAIEQGAGWGGNNFAVNYGASGLKVENMKADYNAHEYLYDKSGAYIDGVLATGSYYAGNANGWGVFDGSLRVRMFGTDRGSVIRTCSVAIYHWKCTKNGEDIINLIPCYSKTTLEIGMLDVVSKTFYTNEGSGEFIKGQNIKL